MNPMDLIKQELGPAQWERCLKAWAEESIINFQQEMNVFPDHKIYFVRGQTWQFDFTTLPHGSYGFYAVSGNEAVRLTRAGKEIERILVTNWVSQPVQDPVKLSSFVLNFYDGGIKSSHRVLADADSLIAMCTHPKMYRVNESSLAYALPRIGETSCTIDGDSLQIRAITLQGWMHRKQNLGIESITISRSGTVTLGLRHVLARKIFDEVPRIMY
jgi:hypothetical protein